MSKPSIGFVGLGRMGLPMASRLVAAGYSVTGYDPVKEALDALGARGGRAAPGAKQVADEAEIVFASLPTPDVVRRVALGDDGIAAGKRVRIFVDLSTTGPRVSAEVGAAIEKGGRIAMVDCPVSGGVAGATKGMLTMMVSGAKAACDEVEPLLKEMGKVMRVGDKPGHAQVVKLANNVMSVSAMAVACEALVFGAKMGVDPKLMMDVINVSSGRSAASQDKIPKHMLTRSFDFGFSTALSQKDTRLCLDEAEALGVPMVIGSAARQVLGMTRALYGPDADFTNMLRVFETLARVEVPKVGT